jgi:hypothetical protein
MLPTSGQFGCMAVWPLEPLVGKASTRSSHIPATECVVRSSGGLLPPSPKAEKAAFDYVGLQISS